MMKVLVLPLMSICGLFFVIGTAFDAQRADPATPATVENPKWKLAVDLADGSRLVGVPSVERIRFKTAEGEREVALQWLIEARLENGAWTVYTEQVDAKKLVGKVTSASLRMKTLVGTVDVPLRHAVRLETYSTVMDVELPARDDLVLYLNLDHESGKQARNLASFRHHAEVHGAEWTPAGKRRGAYQFDGTSTLEVPHHAELCPATFTLTAWVYPSDERGQWRLLLSKTETGSWMRGYGFCRYPNEPDALYFYVGNYSSGAVKESIPRNQWSHIAGVYDGKQVQMYVNGEPSLPRPLGANGMTPTHTSTPFIVGGGGSYNWSGKLDEVMLFRRALSAREIEQVMAAGDRPREDD